MKLSMDCLDISHPQQIQNIVKSKFFKISIGICIIVSLIVILGFIINIEIKSNNELWDKESREYNQQRIYKYEHSKWK